MKFLKSLKEKKRNKKKRLEIIAFSKDLLRMIGRCPSCRNELNGHFYAELASKKWAESDADNVNYFRKCFKERKWEELRKYNEFDPMQDVGIVYLIKCSRESDPSVALLLLNPFELIDDTSVIETSILEKNKFDFSEDILQKLKWEETNFSDK